MKWLTIVSSGFVISGVELLSSTATELFVCSCFMKSNIPYYR